MKRIATTLTMICLAFFLSGCGKSQPSNGERSGDAKVNTAPPTASLGSGSSEPDDGSTNPFEDENNAQKPAAKKKAPIAATPPVKETKK